ncbi:GspH/FimT family pseudopilin [Motilimonas sp. 1_MG-2023]|uniref:GspH/FimT family pseudopilin n=1 Tax=Motilimonas sp. 1_MG-2023 TaxID=3062672 RepID=UPI0026E1B6DA|nr:GspH/FimT family pseudopilin [Motilimonas sp. 1_MG-2023]MDO6526671.1 GspH/FimT family pseudopilin [Motilimonas sp. 1_MG-2023]
MLKKVNVVSCGFNRLFTQGFTLIELMIALVVMGVILGIGLPSYQSLTQDQNLKGIAESTYSRLMHAKSEALKRNQNIYLHFCQQGNKWKTGLTDLASCDCFTANSCTLDGLDTSADWVDGEKITLATVEPVTFSDNKVQFSSVRLTANGGTIRLENAQHKQLNVITSLRGRVRICQVGDVGLGYKECI